MSVGPAGTGTIALESDGTRPTEMEPHGRQAHALAPPADSSARRAIWAARRVYMEEHREKRTPDGGRHRRRWGLFRFLVNRFRWVLWGTGMFSRGVDNALDIRLNRFELTLPGLPEAFDGYTVLHLSDLHADGMKEIEDRMLAVTNGLAVDLLVLTGDYRYRVSGDHSRAIPPLAALRRAVEVRDGALAILGNHDTIDMVEPLENSGYRVLANESVSMNRGGESLHVTGLDDVHYFYTDQALHALQEGPAGFRIALVHSPEMVEQAAAAGISLYLTGHTHGGQICLPGGIPVLTNSSGRRSHTHGVWRCGTMLGYTTTGVGVSGLPVRYNSRGEAALITLRRGAGTPARMPRATSEAAHR